ncbi:universal stress protein [Candidatus Magnetomonas plexicatena]|uniref:universal stress protein n=1 Tax=Candidatus Magnetomonas plexicatena TaxID=2552947 RepID=UPI001C780971|nr:universal stress protein [Nitrospirales bacterium LBB_01]
MQIKISKVLLCHDNGDVSDMAAGVALSIARAFNLPVLGLHGYNAVMHEGAFRIMEPTLPAEYQTEEILAKQREVHASLIRVGMEKISLSYLKPLEPIFSDAQVPFSPKVREGKNFKALLELINEEDFGSLVIIGDSGFNHSEYGFVGSVCTRVLRQCDNKNILIVKNDKILEGAEFVVGLDGSASAVYSLRVAAALAKKFNAKLHLLYVFDSALHNDLFGRLKDTLINDDGFKFNTKDQEKIHDEFIDKGLARVGHMILNKAEKDVFGGNGATHEAKPAHGAMHGFGLVGDGGQNGNGLKKSVLSGHIYKKICDYAKDVGAALVFTGRTGRHHAEGIDIGSVCENVVRYSPCNVMVTRAEDFKGWEL